MQPSADVESLRQQLTLALQRNLHVVTVARALDVDPAVIHRFVSDRCHLAPRLLEKLPAIIAGKVVVSFPEPKQEVIVLTARSLKVTVILNAAEIVAAPVPKTPRVTLAIDAGGRNVNADIATKSLMKAQTAIRNAGVDGCVVLIQGKLVNDAIAEAGLVVQPKAPKAAAA
jgi:hypothetical protein